jgi:hypothetical protein
MTDDPRLVSPPDTGEAIAGAALRFFAADAAVQAAAVREALARVDPPEFRGIGASRADTYLMGVACVYVTYWMCLAEAHPVAALEPLQELNGTIGGLAFQGWKWRGVDLDDADWTRLRFLARHAMDVLAWAPHATAPVFDVDALIAVDEFQATDEQVRILDDDRVEVLLWRPTSLHLAFELLFRHAGTFVVACERYPGESLPLDFSEAAQFAIESGLVHADYQPTLRAVGSCEPAESIVGEGSFALVEAASRGDAVLLAQERLGGRYQVVFPAGTEPATGEALLRGSVRGGLHAEVERLQAAKASVAFSAWPFPAGSERLADLVFTGADPGWLAILAEAARSSGEREFASLDRWRRFGLHAESAVVLARLDEYASLR